LRRESFWEVQIIFEYQARLMPKEKDQSGLNLYTFCTLLTG